MNIALIEPFYGGSHKQWCDGFKRFSKHSITIFSLSPHHWKWRMHGAAIPLARKFLEHETNFDLIIASDFLNVGLFRSLIQSSGQIPIVLYFHENQITYPWSPDDPDVIYQRDHTYGFINYTSALVSDHIFFNSAYHLNSFISNLPGFLKQFPDNRSLETVDSIQAKSEVLPLGLDLSILNANKESVIKPNDPVLLWNHRWEYDKNPQDFFEALLALKAKEINFKLVVLGKEMKASPDIFQLARIKLADHILHWGYCEDVAEYAYWLWLADIVPVTSNQDFFGISVVEAIYCNCWPLLPMRLAYTEHFDEIDNAHVYADQQELVQKLEACCLDLPGLRNRPIKSRVNGYDWSRMASIYDIRFESMI